MEGRKKMKLIDISELKDSLLPELLSGVDGGTDDSWLKAYEVINRIENVVNEWVNNQPTVKAIPIEWIEKQMAERENYGDFNTAGAIGYLLLSWEKENEID